jgi:hypoxanthine phosphoribosyltransferase
MDMTPEGARAALAHAERLYDQAQIETALARMAAQIAADMESTNPIVLCVMNGALIVGGHLLTRLTFPLQLDYIHATRYRGDTRGGELHWHKKPALALRDRTVLLVDDILDEGNTLAAILDYCRVEGAMRTAAAVLVDKRHTRKHPGLRADYVGLTVDDRYVFGFGMDYRGYLRNLPAIYAVNDSSDAAGRGS